MCKVYTGYCGTNEIEHGLCACTVDNPLAKARGLSLRTGAQIMLYLSLVCPSIHTCRSIIICIKVCIMLVPPDGCADGCYAFGFSASMALCKAPVTQLT